MLDFQLIPNLCQPLSSLRRASQIIWLLIQYVGAQIATLFSPSALRLLGSLVENHKLVLHSFLYVDYCILQAIMN